MSESGCGNLRVLNSYWVNQDGVYKYYEVILVDPNHKAVSFYRDRDFAIQLSLNLDPPRRQDQLIVNPVHKRREARGLTSIGKQVCVALVGMLGIFLSLFRLFRTVVLERVIATTTLLLAPPGKSTTLCPCPDTVDCFQSSFVFTITCHTMLYSPMPCMPITLQSHELFQGTMHTSVSSNN